MRFKRAITAVLGVATALSVMAVAPASADRTDYKPLDAPKRPQTVQSNTTDGNSFVEINGAGNLVFWNRDGGSFAGTTRGWGWQNTRAITSLDKDNFLEIKADGRLSKWTYNGFSYNEQVVGWGWTNARLVSGLSSTKFLEVNHQGDLRVWTFDANNFLSATTIGWGWWNTRIVAGLTDTPGLDFLEVKNDGRFSEWISPDGGVPTEYAFEGADLSWARLLVGTDVDHFVVIDNEVGALIEYTYNDSDPQNPRWDFALRGEGWGGTRLIG